MRELILRVALGLLSALLLVVLPAHTQSTAPETGFDLLAKQAAEARNADRAEEAVSLYRSALTLRPEWAEGWWSLGTVEYNLHNYKAAEQAFGRFLRLSPKDGTASVMLGLCEFELGQDEKAFQHLEGGKQLGISDPHLRFALLYDEGLLLLREGSFKAAQVGLSSLCRTDMQSAKVLQSLGLAFLRIPPTDAPQKGVPGAEIVERVGHAACLAAQKKFEQAHREYSALVQEYPDYPNIHYAFGRFCADMDDVPSAIGEFKRELRSYPNDVNSRLEIAVAEYKLDSAAGVPYAEEAVKLNPRVPSAHYLLGLLNLDTDAI